MLLKKFIKQIQLRHYCISFILNLFFCFFYLQLSSQIKVHYDPKIIPIEFAVSKLKNFFGKKNKIVHIQDSSLKTDIRVSVNTKSGIPKEGYNIQRREDEIIISSSDATGAMYGVFELAEQVRSGITLKNIKEKKQQPKFTVRAVKFNLPWIPYRVGPAMSAHENICKDLNFWKSFIDELALNRFNILSLWNVHPFAFMVKPKNFPGANDFTDAEMENWKLLWTSIFRMCRERGIEVFIVNWNIAVTPDFAKHYNVKERNDTSEIVKRYTREVVTQVINEYPDLSGIGITLADWMSNFQGAGNSLPTMTAKDRENWIDETFVAGMKQANRPVKFIHRSVLSSDPSEMRRVINQANLKDTTLVEIKFNWSHGLSTPILAMTHDSHSGKIDKGYWDPMPLNYRVQWMVRNEDIFILRWGQPDFIREHLRTNAEAFVNGYFVGSEGYIPALDLSHIENQHKGWEYAFQKQWLYYMLWGRLLYDASTPDEVFAQAFKDRYQVKDPELYLKAYSMASKMPLRVASFYGATWDYTLYSEGFLAPFSSNGGLHDSISSFISIDELIDHPTLDPGLLSIRAFVEMNNSGKPLPMGKTSPLQLADQSSADGIATLEFVKNKRNESKKNAEVECELDDLETWGYLSMYLANKIKAGVFLHTARTSGDATSRKQAKDILNENVKIWEKISVITSSHYKEMPYVDDNSRGGMAYKDAKMFSWMKYLEQVKRDVILADH